MGRSPHKGASASWRRVKLLGAGGGGGETQASALVKVAGHPGRHSSGGFPSWLGEGRLASEPLVLLRCKQKPRRMNELSFLRLTSKCGEDTQAWSSPSSGGGGGRLRRLDFAATHEFTTMDDTQVGSVSRKRAGWVGGV